VRRFAYCDRPATLLCDGVFAWPAREDDVGRRLGWIDTGAALDGAGSCDRPLCIRHATSVGHTCGSDGCDTIDLCPECAEAEQTRTRRPIMTTAEMIAARRLR